jgi:putative transposase
VSRQGYYAFQATDRSERISAEVKLQHDVRAVFDKNRGRYGSPRIHEQLRRDGIRVSKRRIERVMRALGLVARKPSRFFVTTRSDASHRVEPNLLARDFTAAKPDQRWVTDITYVWTDEGWAFVAAIVDLFSRAVVGWSVGPSLSTELPLAALEMAVTRRRPNTGLMHHSDRGVQYTSFDYRDRLASLGVTVSMSRKGNCWDNAVAESFFATLKTELVHGQRWSSLTELRAALFEYIESYYNRRRLHSALNYKTPAEVEHEHMLATAA